MLLERRRYHYRPDEGQGEGFPASPGYTMNLGYSQVDHYLAIPTQGPAVERDS
jgi:hypothetical protein